MRKLTSFLLAAIIAGTSYSYAADIPPGNQPGAESGRFQEQGELLKKEFQKKTTAAPEIKIQEEAPPAQQEEEITFVLNGVNIKGVTLFKPAVLKPLYGKYIGKEVSLKDINEIVSGINALYKEKGYLTSKAFFPEQDISNGNIEISVMEGKMGDLAIEGNKFFSTSLLKKYFHSKKNEILNIKKLAKDILRLNQNSDLQVKTLVNAGKAPETSDITLTVKDGFPYHAGINADNYGTRLVGKYRSFITFRSTNLTGNMDSVFVSTMLSERAYGTYTSYLCPITTYGTKAGIDVSYFTNTLGKEFKSYNIRGETQSYMPHIIFELALSEKFQANLDMGVELKSIKKYMKKDKTADDQLRLPYLSFDFAGTDSLLGGGHTGFNPKFVFGTTDLPGASSEENGKAGRPGTDGVFFKYEQSVRRTQVMPLESYMQLRSQFQWATNTLGSSEQLQLGGANSVRGYPEGDYLCDTGATLNIDWIFPMYLLPKNIKLPRCDTPLRNQVQPVAFMDMGGGVLKKVMPGERKEKFLMGLGGGLKINLYNKVSLTFQWARAVGEEPVSGCGPSTFYFAIQSEV